MKRYEIVSDIMKTENIWRLTTLLNGKLYIQVRAFKLQNGKKG